MPRLLHVPLRHPRLTLGVLLAITLAAATLAHRIPIDSAIETLLPTDNDARRYADEIHAAFGNEEVTVIGIFAADVFAPATIGKVSTLSTALAALPGVRGVVSLTTVRGVEASDEGLRTGPVMTELPTTPAAAASFRARIEANPLYRGSIVSRDGRATAITVLYEAIDGREMLRRDLDGRIRELVRQQEGPEQMAVSGAPALRAEAARLIRRDLALFIPLSTGLVVLVLGLVFRSPRGVLVPIGMVMMALVWVAAAMVATGHGITMGTLILPPLLMAEGTSYAIHLMSQYYQAARSGRSRDLLEHVLGEAWVPLTVAAFTTQLGFATFLWNEIPAIREFGLYATLGTLVLLVVCLTFVPAVLALLPLPAGGVERSGVHARLDRLFTWLGALSSRHGRRVLGIFAVLALVAVAGVLRLRVETDYLSFFPSSSAVQRDTARIEQALAGTQPFYVVLETGEPRGILRTEALAAFRALDAHLDGLPEVDATFSLLDELALVKRALRGDDALEPPTTSEEAAQLLLLTDPTLLSAVASPDLSRAVILVRTPRTHLAGSRAVGEFLGGVERWAGQHLPPGVQARVTGTAVLLNHSADAIAWGQVTGLWQMLLTLLVLLSAMFLSVRVGLLSLVPNVFPILVLFGIMGWAGIDLNVSTSLIAAIALGIVVDDTFHFLTSFNVEVRRTGSQEQAAQKTLRTHGPAMVATAVALAAGYLVVGFSNFGPVRDFGVLASLTMLIGVVTDLFVTPAMLQQTRIITVWDLVRLKLGPRPQDSVPMLGGLGPLGARIVVLVSRIATARAGSHLATRGETRDELYVLLDGRAEVRGEDGRVLAVLGRGDVTGEMGALRRRPRTADVVATEDTEYLVIDERFLQRLRRRYPRLAATVFLNLTRILSDRLETTTGELASEARAARTA